jgi:hypothetical protein
MKKYIACIALLGLISTSSHAAFVDTDWKVQGDALSTLDEDTGIEWLKLTQTIGMSINTVQSLLDTSYAGWRLPTRAEVNQAMFSVTGLAAVNNGINEYDQIGTTYENKARAFHAAFGSLVNIRTVTFSEGHYLNTDVSQGGTEVLMTGAHYVNTSYQRGRLFDDWDRGDDLDYDFFRTGVFLVSDGGTTVSSRLTPSININNSQSPINNASTPAALGVLSISLMGFFCRKKQG